MLTYNRVGAIVILLIVTGCVTPDLSGNDKSKPPSSVVVEADEEACENGKAYMEVRVTISGDRRKVNAFCAQAFSDNFKAKSGVTCAITAGMCSGYFPQEKFIVSCDDGQSDSVGIDCP